MVDIKESRATVEFHRSLKKKGVTQETVRLFRNIIKHYYRRHGRHDLPWRHTKDPYHILVSEIMLQQTQVERVIDKYFEFLALFPDFPALAQSSIHSVVSAWKGLGYNRRALALRTIAKTVMKEHKGALPSSPAVLETLPGIGKATAASICAFAFNMPVVFIETNIRRVFIQFFFSHKKTVRDRDILPLVEKTLVQSKPAQWYSALMDYGTMLKKRVPNPNIKSAHYTKQSPFEGSNRQIRGQILRLLTEQSGVSLQNIAEHLKAPEEKVEKIILQLAEEGFIKKRGKQFRMG